MLPHIRKSSRREISHNLFGDNYTRLQEILDSAWDVRLWNQAGLESDIRPDGVVLAKSALGLGIVTLGLVVAVDNRDVDHFLIVANAVNLALARGLVLEARPQHGEPQHGK